MSELYIGLMSGTSLDGVDGVLIDFANGPFKVLAHQHAPFDPPLRSQLLALNQSGPDELHRSALAANALSGLYAQVVQSLLTDSQLQAEQIRAIGAHGQTVRHQPGLHDGIGYSLQIQNPSLLAELSGIAVVADWRSRDVAAGGQGAPLVPVYHAALARRSALIGPVAILNIGGVANVTFVGEGGDLLAFDTGPGNGPLDQWVESHGLGRYDAGGALSQSGQVHEAVLAQMMSHNFFTQTGPKSLDRYDFTAKPVEGLSPEDGAATLAAFVAQSVAHGLGQAPQPPRALMVCGGGRHNGAILEGLRQRCGVQVVTAEEAGWRGDAVEAEAFAFLAARTVRGLPISFPGTTGVAQPLVGGQVVEP